jgi:hypothetical protein
MKKCVRFKSYCNAHIPPLWLETYFHFYMMYHSLNCRDCFGGCGLWTVVFDAALCCDGISLMHLRERYCIRSQADLTEDVLIDERKG